MTSSATLAQLAHSTGTLLYLGLDPEVRLCTYGSVNVAGQAWLLGDFTLDGVARGPRGIEAVKVVLGDIDFAWAQQMMRDFQPGIVCRVSLLHRGATAWEAREIFRGFIERPSISRDGQVTLEARVPALDVAVTPRVPFQSPYSLARNSEVVINGTTYRVE